jgi:hypothetical protein
MADQNEAFEAAPGVSAALLAGCGGSQPPIAAPGAMPQTSAGAVHVERDESWTLPEAKNEDLLYVANYSNVLMFTYPAGKLVGTINGFTANASECVDAESNVYVTNFKPPALYEYAHGATKRIGKFLPQRIGAGACAVDPTSGNIAASGNSSFVDIFKPGNKKPLIVNDPKMFYNGACVYDNTGNLFVDGLRSPKGPALLAELPKGRNRFVNLKLDAAIDDESLLVWDGRHLDVISYLPNRAHKNEPAIYQFEISGKDVKKVGAARLLGADFVVDFSVYKEAVIVSNWNLKNNEKGIFFYRYPQGGKPTSELTKSLTSPRGVVVSPAQ